MGDRAFLRSEQAPSGASRAPGLRRAAGSPQAQRNIGGDPALRQGGACKGREGDAWTINNADEMRRLLDFGVDVIMTDRPGTLAEVLDRSGSDPHAAMSSTMEATPKSV